MKKKKYDKFIFYISMFILLAAVTLFTFITYLFFAWLMSLVPQVGIFGILMPNFVLVIGVFIFYSFYMAGKDVYRKNVK